MHAKRNRSRSADTDKSTVQTSDPTSEQSFETSYSAKRRRSPSIIRNDSVSNGVSRPKPASSPVHNGTNPQTDNANDNYVSDEDDSGEDQRHLHIHSNGRRERY
ncbi:hypothetical protein H2201_003213 [Coniosporium apollinis]|uniref:Uncharacterized protein n=2 Tax=Coniosporium TaxID=2810619 RepID=A0ABQ9NW00_9PEZI|nr:hypothetical protein H2199_008738 [Cladosporium sp. JES 115]KAJ9666556.1 hypothetical protein H2201_003213 [Coniosporium apollinis]